MPDLSKIHASGWEISQQLWEQQDDYGKSFMMLELSGQKTREYYQDRLRALGFSGMERVLDVGCGLGQWASAMADMNREVHGIDLNDARLDIARHLAGVNGNSRVYYQNSSAEHMPFEDGCFDGLFCYGVFMFTDMLAAMREFRRVLKPGGRLYFNANTWGWYLHMLIDLGIRPRNLNMIKTSVRMMLGYMQGKRQSVLVTEGFLRALLCKHGFDVLALDVEGHAPDHLASGGHVPAAAYPGSFYGARSILEAVAVRN